MATAPRESISDIGFFGPIIEQAVDAVVVIDGCNNVVLFNAAAEQLWGIDRNTVLGRNVRSLMPANVRARYEEQIESNRLGGDTRLVGATLEVPIDRPDGTRNWGSLSLSRTRIRETIYYAAFIKDVTEEVHRREELYLLSLVANETDRAVLITDCERRAIYANRAFMELFGYGREELIGAYPPQLLAGRHTNPETLMALGNLTSGDRGEAMELIAYHKDGREIWVAATVNPVFGADGNLRNAVSVISNITETRQTQVLQQRILESVARDDDLEVVANLICREVETIAPGVICSVLRVDDQKALRPLASPSLPAFYSEALDGLPIGPSVGSCGTAAWRGEPVLVEDIETDPLWAPYKELPLPLGLKACWSSPLKLKDGRVAGTFAFYYSEKRGPSAWHERLVEACVHLCVLAIERHEAKAHIARLAYFDTLTGLPNRSQLAQAIDERIAKAQVEPSPGMALLFLDVDGFKDVNDSLGHSAGDALLVEIGQRLRSQVRPGDMVSRLGGDEFVIVLGDCASERAALVAERVAKALAMPADIDGVALSASVSIGISLYPSDSLDREELLKHADTAMYEAKNAGRGAFRFYSPGMNDQIHERLVMGNALKESLRAGHLQLHYQPQILGGNGKLHGVEALARWNHPVFGQVPPSRFIALAEECGLIEAIGEWALCEACRQLAEWRAQGLAIPTVSVNLSPLHFRNPHLPALVAAALEASGLSAEALTLEITEGVMMDKCAATIATVEAVAGLGVRLSLDDFGTGYSSLSSVSRLPIAEIKLDQSFVRDLQTDKNARAVASAVIRIGQSLGLTVVAEGVETEPQRRFLQGLNCQAMQGYLFSPALAPAALVAWLTPRDELAAATEVA
ncbi:MAG: EAL domain-containing protein [Phreatobacter sp.]|uniref:EAL domain-containing protein n=1 Tax=Phreatobacter sp. TaxID=1966341 RepID=UPI0027360941|nr:EAL domain-containing protein [Phreatobacter sp.]MDP2802542.1 EAL domain-containing protein [Phreatobacter sp.]